MANFKRDPEYSTGVTLPSGTSSANESDLQLRLALDAARLGTYERDLRTGIGHWSPRACEIYGVPPDQGTFTKETWFALVHPDDRDKIDASLANAIAGHGPHDVEYRIIRPDGEVRWVAARGEILYDEEGRPVRTTGVCYDITSQKQTEAALRESEQRFRDIAANFPGIIFRRITYPDGRIEYPYVSKSFDCVFEGLSEAMKSVGTLEDVARFVDMEDLPRWRESWRTSLAEQRPLDIEGRFRAADGKIRWFRSISMPHPRADGATIWDGVLLDITAQKEAEARLHEILDQREALLRETHHRIKNSIAAVAAMLRIQARMQQSEEARTQLLDAVRRVANIGRIHQALYLSDTFETIDIGAHLRAVLKDLTVSTPTHRGKRPDVQITCPEGIMLTTDIVTPLSLIAVELVVNAIKHADKATSDVRVDVTFEPGDPIRLRVVDNGPGFSGDLTSHGSGFGLRLVEILVQQLGGDIVFESRVHGTAVTVTVPNPPPPGAHSDTGKGGAAGDNAAPPSMMPAPERVSR